MAEKGSQEDSSKRPSESAEVLRPKLLEGYLNGLKSLGFTPAEIRAALDVMEGANFAKTSEHTEREKVQPLSTSSAPAPADTLARIHQTNAAVFQAIDEAFSSPETPLEADHFSKEALLRVNAIYQVTPEAELKAFLDDDQYITCRRRLCRDGSEGYAGSNLPPPAIPIAQQLFCALPKYPQSQREELSIGISSGFYDLNTAYQPIMCTQERDLLWSDAQATEKGDFLRNGFLSGTPPLARPRFDCLQKTAVLNRYNDRALPSYALLRLFRRGLLKDTFKREHYHVDGDSLFVHYADTDSDGHLNMALYKDDKVMISINNSHRTGNKYELFDLSPELTALVLAECHAICLELLPSINYIHARQGGVSGQQEAISKLLANSNLSGLRLNSRGEIESTAKNGNATPVSIGATNLGRQWYARGREDFEAAQTEFDRKQQLAVQHNRVFGGDYDNELGKRIQRHCIYDDMISGLYSPEFYSTLPILPLQISFNHYLRQCAEASSFPPLPDKAKWLSLKTKIQTSEAFQELTNKIIALRNWRDVEAKPEAWPKEGKWVKKPSRQLYDDEKTRRTNDLQSTFGRFIREFLFADPELGPYFCCMRLEGNDSLKIKALASRIRKFPEEAYVDVDTDITTLAGDIMRAVAKQYESVRADLQTGLKTLLAAYDQAATRLTEAEKIGVKIPDDKKQEAQLSPEIYKSLRQQAGLEAAID